MFPLLVLNEASFYNLYQNELLYKCKDMVSHYENDSVVRVVVQASPAGELLRATRARSGIRLDLILLLDYETVVVTRCRTTMAHIRQSRPDSGLGFQV